MKKQLISLTSTLAMALTIYSAAAQSYTPEWESLRKHENPEWALDAKFGIYAHWGPYSQAGAWEDVGKQNWGNYYATPYRGIYSSKANEPRRAAFERRYGKTTEGNGYRDFCETMVATGFDAARFAELVEISGAEYAGICAIHHDGFAMWDSDIIDLCAGKMGPKRDLLGEVFEELNKRDIKSIATFHHERTFKHYSGLQNSLRKNNVEGVDLIAEDADERYWFLNSEDRFAERRINLTLEVIDKYHPDVLWFDGGGGDYGTEKILAHFFNTAERDGREVCVHNKGNFGTNFGIYSYENGAYRPGFVDWPWEDDTPSARGWCDWPWWYGIEYKTPEEIIVRLCDLVSRNGGLLLSLNPRPDGSLDREQEELLIGIGEWMSVNSEAIHGSRPWVIYAEGHIEPQFYCETHPETGESSREIQPDLTKFDQSDIRFTTKGNTLYAMQLAIPTGGMSIIRSLGEKFEISDKNKIKSIELLGYGEVDFKRTSEKLEITLPEQLPNNTVLTFKINIKGELKQRTLEGKNKVIPMQT